MADQLIVDKSFIVAIADAIRAKEGSSDLIATVDMAQRIMNLRTYGDGYSDGYSAGQLDWQPVSFTLDDNGNLVVKNLANSQVFSATATNSYNSAKSTYNPTTFILSNEGKISAFNASGTLLLESIDSEHSFNAGKDEGYDNGYETGYANSKSDYEPTSKSLSDDGVLKIYNTKSETIYETTVTNSYNSAKTTYNPSSLTLDREGKVSVYNSNGTLLLEDTDSEHSFDAGRDEGYDDGYSAGEIVGKDEGEIIGRNAWKPTSYTLSISGDLVVKNSAGDSIYTATVTNSYNAGYSEGETNGYSAGQTEWKPISHTIATNGDVSIKNANSTEIYSFTVSLSDLGYTEETSLNGTLSGTTYKVRTPQTKGYHSSQLGLDVTPVTLGLTLDAKLIGSLAESTYTYTVKTQMVKGYHTSQLTLDVTPETLGLSAKPASTITPTTYDQTIAVGKYISGIQTIKGDANLVAGNIKKGATIFGVEGIYEGGGTTSASWSSSITLSISASDGYQPLVVTAGQTNVNYLMSLTIDSGKKVESIYIDGTLRDLWCGSSSEISSLRGDVTIKGATATTSYALGTGGALSIKEYGSTTEYQIASAGKININNLSSKNLRKGVTILNVSAVSYAPDYGSMSLSANCRYVTITNNSGYTLRYIYSTATGTNSSDTVNSRATSGRLNAGSAYASIYQGICITTYGTNNVVLTFYSASSGDSAIQTITLSGYRHYVIRMSSSSYSSARTLYWYGI